MITVSAKEVNFQLHAPANTPPVTSHPVPWHGQLLSLGFLRESWTRPKGTEVGKTAGGLGLKAPWWQPVQRLKQQC